MIKSLNNYTFLFLACNWNEIEIDFFTSHSWRIDKCFNCLIAAISLNVKSHMLIEVNALLVGRDIRLRCFTSWENNT